MRFPKHILFLVWLTLVFSLTSGSVQQERFMLPPQPTQAAAEAPATTTSTTERRDRVPTSQASTRPSNPATTAPAQPTTTAPETTPEPAGIPRVVVESIGVDEPLVVGNYFDENGNISPPWQTANLYGGGSMPGQVGTSLIAGHVSSSTYGPDVFYNLGNIQIGDIVQVSDGTTNFTYQVTLIRVQDKRLLATSEAPGEDPDAVIQWSDMERVTDWSVLYLITCGGEFGNVRPGSFDSNIIVRAEIVP